ncbi:17983_t:CDS:1 [Racocetra persica]|uniref:17983_t:CDS:1 n=1 Tax=Racocetra persica TaxID=160502 RepID=A0ACA9QWG8_9GLOM|nr:17983_t:CDS:1 [Racocetra persica]
MEVIEEDLYVYAADVSQVDINSAVKKKISSLNNSQTTPEVYRSVRSKLLTAHQNANEKSSDMSLVEPGKHFIDLTDNSHHSKRTRVQDLKNKDDCVTNVDPNYGYCEQTIEYDREYVNDNSECDSTVNENEKIVLSHKNMNKGKEKITQSVTHNTRSRTERFKNVNEE